MPENKVNDAGMKRNTIRKEIAKRYISKATVLILLCGKNTNRRKFIDWELHAAMIDTERNQRMGILVINLPTIQQCQYAGEEQEKIIISDDVNTNWISLSGYEEYEKDFPYLPSRITDNLVENIPISVVNWSTINNKPEVLKALIHKAFLRRKRIEYINRCELRKNNGRLV